jgi:acetoin utilization deacetylase AcuC-like enzyme
MQLPIFYNPRMTVPSNNSFSPSAGKPAAVVADWASIPTIADHVEVVSFNPVGEKTIAQAHAPDYVRGVLASEVANGFNNRLPEVAQSLPYTVGSIVAAAKYVLREGRAASEPSAAVSPTSGFHHANHAHGWGFCTFNGLVVAAMELKRLGLANSIVILDYDYHHGDGTDDIIKRLGLDYIQHFSAGSVYKSPADAPRLLDEINMRFVEGLGGKRSQPRPPADVVLYQAGADQHRDDPLGGVLSTAELADRDYQVFRNARLYGIPIVWNLAGGYQLDKAGRIEPVLEIHRNTMHECLRVMVHDDY